MRAWQWPMLATALLLATVPAVAGQLGLKECVGLALARAPSAAAAAAEARAAHERVRAAKAAYMPSVSGHAEYGVAGGYDDTVTNGGSTAAVLRMQFAVLDGGLRRAEVEAANADLRSAGAVEDQRRADVVLAVRTAYLTALGSADEARIQTGAARSLGDYASLLGDQETRGLVPRDDVLRAEIALETARDAERSASARAVSATRELSALAGVEIGVADLVAPEEPAAPNSAGSTDSAETSIDESPLLHEARARAEAARREVDVAASERRGHLTFDADAGFLGVTPDRAFRDNGGAQFLLGFTVPIYDGGATAARVAAASAMAASAEAGVAEARQRIAIELARLAVEAERARVQEQSWRRAAPRADDAFQLMRARYFGGGNVRLLEVLDALKQTVDTRAAAARARLDYGLAIAERDHLLGVMP